MEVAAELFPEDSAHSKGSTQQAYQAAVTGQTSEQGAGCRSERHVVNMSLRRSVPAKNKK